ncbi:hypothetical protein ACS0TY_020855 [Phlomoides rotata]
MDTTPPVVSAVGHFLTKSHRIRIKMRLITRKKAEILVLIKGLMHKTMMVLACAFLFLWMKKKRLVRNRNPRRFSLLDQIPGQLRNMRDLMDAPKCGGVEPEKGKTTRVRRSWTKIEEDALIRYLLDIVSDGWKADNGFKAGF